MRDGERKDQNAQILISVTIKHLFHTQSFRLTREGGSRIKTDKMSWYDLPQHLGAAFDAIDIYKLLQILHDEIEIDGTALE